MEKLACLKGETIEEYAEECIQCQIWVDLEIESGNLMGLGTGSGEWEKMFDKI